MSRTTLLHKILLIGLLLLLSLSRPAGISAETSSGVNSPTELRNGGKIKAWNGISAGIPSARYLHTAIWTGTEMIVWGGGAGSGKILNDGWRYNPTTDSWVPLSSAGAPSAWVMHTAIWTGTEMIVWRGGSGPTPWTTARAWAIIIRPTCPW